MPPTGNKNHIANLEHDSTFRVKKVSIFNDDGSGNLVRQGKVATEAKQDDIIAAIGNQTTSLSGAGANGTRALALADTWYSVPSTVPTAPYKLIATIENAAGTIRLGFSNSGTPSATNGNFAPSMLEVSLAAGEVVYYASDVGGDDINWTTKEI